MADVTHKNSSSWLATSWLKWVAFTSFGTVDHAMQRELYCFTKSGILALHLDVYDRELAPVFEGEKTSKLYKLCSCPCMLYEYDSHMCERGLVCPCVCDVVGEAVPMDLTGTLAGLCFHYASSLSATETDKNGDFCPPSSDVAIASCIHFAIHSFHSLWCHNTLYIVS